MEEVKKRIVTTSKFAFWSRILGNVFLVMAGITAVFVTPPSVADFGIIGLLGVIWVTMLLGGSIMAIVGMFTGKRLIQFLGPSLVIGSFILWAISLMTKPEATASSFTVAFVFLAFACMKVCLMFMVPSSRVENV